MPKIPTFKSQTTMTSASPSVESNLSINPSDNIYRATKSLTDYVANEYVKEAKLEADNKATLALNELFINQQDGTKGLYSIQAETKTNSKPLEAAAGFDDSVNKLWNYAKTNKLQNFNNFTQKALEKKFYATAGLFKSKALLGSRTEQILETKKITNDVVLKESLALVLNGTEYLPAYKNKIEARLNEESSITEKGVLKEELKTALIFGEIQLGNSLVAENPYQLKQDISKFTNLSLDQKSKLLANADATIKDKKFNYLLSDLKILENKTSIDIVNDFSGIKQGTFNGDVNKIKLFQSLKENEKSELINLAETQRKESNAEINNINSAIRYQFRDESISNSVRIYDSYKTKGIFNVAEINQVFGDYKDDINISTKQQFINLATKQGNNELKNISNYYKNDEITSKILEGKIKDISTPFVLQGEDKPLSILQRAGDGINSDVDLKFYIDYLLPNIKDPSFVEDNKELFKFIKKYQAQIEGPIYSKYIDKNLDNRLNTFKNDMFKKFIEKRRIGEPVKDLLSKESKKFIGNNISNYLPTQGEIEKGMLENFETEGEKKYPPKFPNETKDQYLKRIGF